MIIGSGLVASGLHDISGVIQYAAGVSNSRCEDAEEFERDKARLAANLSRPGLFVYFSTCTPAESAYVDHKRACEQLVQDRGDYLICRLPIVAGKTSNPHTLLNFLYSRIARSEKFDLIPEARRNIIDMIDVSTIVRWLIKNGAKDETVNVAAPMDYSMREIVGRFEALLNKPAIVKERSGGHEPRIDVARIADAPVCWDGEYLGDILWKRYG
ncbi:MAG: NAD-dependent dehydratase [Betaproteobacteria bacterium]|nr:NAD-dependent dehydratase [Betaproteobacteria bacterium]